MQAAWPLVTMRQLNGSGGILILAVTARGSVSMLIQVVRRINIIIMSQVVRHGQRLSCNGLRQPTRLCSQVPLHGLVAQWITRLTTDQKIPGSNPGKIVKVLLKESTHVNICFYQYQIGSAALNRRLPWVSFHHVTGSFRATDTFPCFFFN